MSSAGQSGQVSADEFVERLKEIVAANVEGNTQLVTRFGDFVKRLSREVGDVRPGERSDAEALLARWLEFNLASYSVVSAQGLALLNGLLSAAESTLVTKERPAPDTRPEAAPRVELRLSGRHGERATTGFVIENHFDRRLVLTFAPTDLVPTSGAPLPASLVSFQPSELEIPPRGQGVVEVSVTITTDFVVGQTYATTIRLLGFDGKELGLSVTALPTDDAGPPEPTPKPTKSRKPVKKRRPKATKTKARAAAKSASSSKARKPREPAKKQKPPARK